MLNSWWKQNACTVVICGFFGDTGKGKINSYLSLKDRTAVAVRAGVGPNAGHIEAGKAVRLAEKIKTTGSDTRPCNAERGIGLKSPP